MPFVKIGGDVDWIYIKRASITVSKSLRKYFTLGRKFQIYYDKENKLFAVKEDNTGYQMSKDGRINSRLIVNKIPTGRYFAYWDGDEGQVVADFTKKISDN